MCNILVATKDISLDNLICRNDFCFQLPVLDSYSIEFDCEVEQHYHPNPKFIDDGIRKRKVNILTQLVQIEDELIGSV